MILLDKQNSATRNVLYLFGGFLNCMIQTTMKDDTAILDAIGLSCT
jgi:hypothetical protein